MTDEQIAMLRYLIKQEIDATLQELKTLVENLEAL